MDLREFAYLVALAEEGSVSKAADRLFMAQSSLSQFLTQFESDIGVKLFIRSSKGIRPTSSGKIFIERLERIMADYQHAKSELWDSEKLKGGRVSLGISSFRGRRMLPLILKRFRALYPDVRVDVIEANSLALEDLLLEGRLDVGIIALPASKLKNGTRFLVKDEILLLAPKSHPVLASTHLREDRKGRWVALKDAARYDFVLSYHDTILGTIARKLFREKRLQYHAVHDNITAEMAVSMAMEGIGLAFTYGSYIEPDEKLELLRIGEKGVFLDLGVAFPSQVYHSRASEAMEEIIRSVYLGR